MRSQASISMPHGVAATQDANRNGLATEHAADKALQSSACARSLNAFRYMLHRGVIIVQEQALQTSLVDFTRIRAAVLLNSQKLG